MHCVFVHGLGQQPNSWREAAAGFCGGYDAVYPNLAALLHSGDGTYQKLSRAFSTFCDALDGEILLCGLSLGAVLSLQYAAGHPRKVHAAILAAPQFQVPQLTLKAQDLMFRAMPKPAFRKFGFTKEECRTLTRSMQNLDLSEQLKAVSCPVLVLCGANDSANRSAAAELSQRLPNADFRILPKTGHELNAQAPRETAALVNAFLKREFPDG